MSCLPESVTPECWNDEKRLNVLFAPIRPRSVNPQDWNSKYTFWKNLISDYCFHSNIYSFKISDLQNVFKKNGRSPCCLEAVVEEMVKNGDCVPLKIFLQSTPNTWGKWIADTLVMLPIVWSLNSLRSSYVQERCPVYVHVDTVRKEAEDILLLACNQYKNKVINLEELLSLKGHGIDKINDVKLLIHYLQKEGKATVKNLNTSDTDINNVKHFLIKFGDKNVQPISNVEIGIHTLEENEKTLLKNVEKLENDIIKLKEEAKSHLLNNHRQIAKSCLRKKHELEKCLIKRANALHNVQTLLAKVYSASTDAEVLESYKLASSSLRDIFKRAGLSDESVTATMLEVGELLEIHDEIEHSLSEPVTNEGDTDVEEELAELLATKKSNEAVEVPITDPNIEEIEKRLEQLNLPDTPVSKVTPSSAKVSL